MKKSRFFVLATLLLLLALLAGCNTIGSENMSYLGDDYPTSNVWGRARHTDWAGIGVSADDYIQQYENARGQAYRVAERLKEGDQPPVLRNIKVFREQRYWPQVLAVLLYTSGTFTLLETDNPGLAGVQYGLGAIFLPINQYDLYLIGDFE